MTRQPSNEDQNPDTEAPVNGRSKGWACLLVLILIGAAWSFSPLAQRLVCQSIFPMLSKEQRSAFLLSLPGSSSLDSLPANDSSRGTWMKRVVETLMPSDGEQVAEFLMPLLAHEDPDVVFWAAYSLQLKAYEPSAEQLNRLASFMSHLEGQRQQLFACSILAQSFVAGKETDIGHVTLEASSNHGGNPLVQRILVLSIDGLIKMSKDPRPAWRQASLVGMGWCLGIYTELPQEYDRVSTFVFVNSFNQLPDHLETLSQDSKPAIRKEAKDILSILNKRRLK